MLNSYYDNQRKSQEVQRRIAEVQKPWQDNSSQEKHNERCKIAVEVNGASVATETI